MLDDARLGFSWGIKLGVIPREEEKYPKFLWIYFDTNDFKQSKDLNSKIFVK